MMAVDFCDYFWGEKHDGFNVIYQVRGNKHFAPQGRCLTKAMGDNFVPQNMKSGLVAAKELTDVARETALMQENSAKVFCDKLTCQSVHAINLNSRCT